MNGLVIDSLCQRFTSQNGEQLNVLDQVSFCVPPGKIVALLGPSGCGKTSLLNIVAGFEKPTAGSVRFAGAPVDAPSSDRCVVFQTPALFEWLTVQQNVTYGLKRAGIAAPQRRELAEQMLHQVGLEAFDRHYPFELSGGMQQRVALARALVLNPRLLLMDEPFAALDAHLRGQMQQLLLSLWQAYQQTILFVTHDLSEALQIADTIVVLGRRPASVREILPVPIAQSQRADVLAHPVLSALRTRLNDLLHAL